MAFDDINDITIPRRNRPKKIDYWYYENTEEIFKEQVRYLKDQNRILQEEISSLRNPKERITVAPTEHEIRVEPTPVKVTHKMNPALMEHLEREAYWKAEIARRAKEAKVEPQNTVEVED